MKLSDLKSATCKPCLQSWVLCCIVILFDFIDQALIQIKRSEKVQHIDSAKREIQNDPQRTQIWKAATRVSVF